MLSLKQKLKIVDLTIIVMIIMLVFEVIFAIPNVLQWLQHFVEQGGVAGWIAVALLQFIQVALIPIPSSFITLISMQMFPNQMWLLFLVTLIAIVLGVMFTYGVGRKWGKKAVIWVAGNEYEYNKWTKVFKSKKADFVYFLTIVFPIFPDDVLCLVAGSMKMRFWKFLLSNIIGRAIGLATFMFVFNSIGNDWITVLIFITIVVLGFIYRSWLKHKLKKEVKMNLVIIGKDGLEPIADDIWKRNTNYTILNKSPYLWGKDYIKFCRERDVIVLTTPDQFIDKKINDVLDYFTKYNYIPIFIADKDNEELLSYMNTALSDTIPESILWVRNKKNEGYDEFIKICQGYLFLKGINNDKTLQTPRGRKKSSSKK